MVPFVPNNSSNSTPTSVKKGQGTHPVDVFHKAWMKALKQGENARKTFDSDVFANSIRVHVKQLMQAPCKDLKQLKPTTCTCMKDITLTDEELEPVVQSIMEFGMRKKTQQQELIFDIIRMDRALYEVYEGNQHQLFKIRRCVLPGASCVLICKRAIAALYGYGRRKWSTVEKLVAENRAPTHGLVGKRGNNYNKDYNEKMNAFFDAYVVPFVNPRATVVVKTRVADRLEVDLRDHDEDVLELPSSYTKRGLYCQLVSEFFGWRLYFNTKGKLTRKEQRLDMENPPAVCFPSWKTFLDYWEENHPKVVVPRPREDVCDDCWAFANAFRHNDRMKQLAKDREVEDDDLADDESSATTDTSDEDTEDEYETAVIPQGEEDLVLDAAAHVEMAQKQRALFNQKCKQAKKDLVDGTIQEERTVTLVADYA